jgi:hypothetical protein
MISHIAISFHFPSFADRCKRSDMDITIILNKFIWLTGILIAKIYLSGKILLVRLG